MSGREAERRPGDGGVLVYDGDCDLCERWSRALLRVAGLPADARAPHHALAPDVRAAVEAAGLRNELKRVQADGVVVGGMDAIRATCRGTRLAPFAWFVGLPGLRRLAQVLYRVVAYNRRVLSPRPSGLACPCDPDPHHGYNLAFVLGAGVVVALGWWVLLVSGDAALSGRPFEGLLAAAWRVPLLFGPVLGVVAVPRGRRLRWASHLLWCFARAALAFAVGAAGMGLARTAGVGRGVELVVFFVGAAWGALRFAVSLRRALPTMRVLASGGLPSPPSAT